MVIVSHNRAAQLRKSLEQLGDAHQVLVVDNGSQDETAELEQAFPAVRFIKLPKNFGLTKAMNIGARAADGAMILFLHDDARISGESVQHLADFLEARTDVGAVCPLLVDDQGKALRQVRALPTPGAPDPPYAPATGGDEIVANCVSGAAIMLRTYFLKALRDVDERYGNYGSCAELSAQVRRANRKLVILSNVTAVHEWAESPAKRSALEADRAHGTGAFLSKHHGFMAGFIYRLRTGLVSLLTLRFATMNGAFSGVKIDGNELTAQRLTCATREHAPAQ